MASLELIHDFAIASLNARCALKDLDHPPYVALSVPNLWLESVPFLDYFKVFGIGSFDGIWVVRSCAQSVLEFP